MSGVFLIRIPVLGTSARGRRPKLLCFQSQASYQVISQTRRNKIFIQSPQSLAPERPKDTNRATIVALILCGQVRYKR